MAWIFYLRRLYSQLLKSRQNADVYLVVEGMPVSLGRSLKTTGLNERKKRRGFSVRDRVSKCGARIRIYVSALFTKNNGYLRFESLCENVALY